MEDKMKLSELTDQEKSVMLARLVGWQVSQHSPPHGQVLIYGFGADTHAVENLYHPSAMSLAWRVMLYGGNMGYDDAIMMWFNEEGICMLPAADAQCMWLDKILELAIEAGMVK